VTTGTGQFIFLHGEPRLRGRRSSVSSQVGGGIDGVAVDAYGNVYFADSTSSTVSVVYRGGTQVANFIKLVNPAAVANSPNGR